QQLEREARDRAFLRLAAREVVASHREERAVERQPREHDRARFGVDLQLAPAGAAEYRESRRQRIGRTIGIVAAAYGQAAGRRDALRDRVVDEVARRHVLARTHHHEAVLAIDLGGVQRLLPLA